MHPLDRPVWASLSTAHAPLSEGGLLARRFARDVNLFASATDDSEAAQAALVELVRPGERIFVLQAGEIVVPPGLTPVKRAMGVQMVASRPMPAEHLDDRDVETLSDGDAPEMLALATLTEPGPFLPRTHAMGRFRGVRSAGRLAAMAGERMRLPGFTEVSGVCTHPDHRGRGLARRLSALVAAGIEARDETPFLHAWETNTPAIALYESLGFVLRCKVHVAVLARP
jgi:predicted GNAT family acetyltransferase